MAQPQQQEEGWPLGLQPVNVRVGGLMRNRHDLNASLSLSSNTLLTPSSISSDDFSSDLDTQSTGSFFHDKSITLGSLIGISSILELSRRSRRGRVAPDEAARNKRNYKTKTWFLSLCCRLGSDAVSLSNNVSAPSLAHLLEAERRGASSTPPTDANYGLDDFSHHVDSVTNTHSLFVGGDVAPPQSSTPFARDLLSHHNADAPPLLLSCLCGNLAHS